MKKIFVFPVLLTLMVFLNGSAFKANENTIGLIPDSYLSLVKTSLPNNVKAASSSRVTAVYDLVLVYDAGVDPDDNWVGKFQDAALSKDVNFWTELGGLRLENGKRSKVTQLKEQPGKDYINIQAVVKTGKYTEAQRIFNAAADNVKFMPANYEWLTYLEKKSTHYGSLGLYRYGFKLGRDKMFKAADLDDDCPKSFNTIRPRNQNFVVGKNGQPQRECDYMALQYVRDCLYIAVSGIPEKTFIDVYGR